MTRPSPRRIARSRTFLSFPTVTIADTKRTKVNTCRARDTRLPFQGGRASGIDLDKVIEGAPTQSESPRIAREGEELTAKVLPGFAVAVGSIFA